MAGYLILGAGKFGRLALERLARRDGRDSFWLVDHDPAALAAVRDGQSPGVCWAQEDAVAFLRDRLADGPWDWLIPTVPLHVAFAYLAADPKVGAAWETVAVPEAVGAGVKTVHRGPDGELLLSRAGHRCPDDCLEDPVCPISGELRERPLHEELAALKIPGFAIKVVASRQLAPGVGGYPPRQLLELAQELEGCRANVLIATACGCHGVVHGLRRRSGR